MTKKAFYLEYPDMLNRPQLIELARNNGFAGVAEEGGEVRMTSEVFWTRLERLVCAVENMAEQPKTSGCAGKACGPCTGSCSSC